jgi:hypothetical protein
MGLLMPVYYPAIYEIFLCQRKQVSKVHPNKTERKHEQISVMPDRRARREIKGCNSCNFRNCQCTVNGAFSLYLEFAERVAVYGYNTILYCLVKQCPNNSHVVGDSITFMPLASKTVLNCSMYK